MTKNPKNDSNNSDIKDDQNQSDMNNLPKRGEKLLKIINNEVTNDNNTQNNTSDQASSSLNFASSSSNKFFKIFNDKILKTKFDFKFFDHSSSQVSSNKEVEKDYEEKIVTNQDQAKQSQNDDVEQVQPVDSIHVERKKMIRKNKSTNSLNKTKFSNQMSNEKDSSDAFSIVSQDEIDKLK